MNSVNLFGHKIVSRDFANAVNEKVLSLSPQYPEAEKFLQRVMSDPRNTVSQLSGYSQGSYMIKLGAKYHIPVTTFNAWFLYSSLSNEEVDYLMRYAPLFKDYRKTEDDVAKYNDRNNPHNFLYFDQFKTIHWVNGSSHKIEDWYFDKKTGQVLDKKSGKVVVSGVSQVFIANSKAMVHFESLKKKWSAGGLNSTEQIFLDAAQGHVIGTSMAAAAQTGADELAKLAQQADAEAQAIWEAIDFSSYQDLSPDEVFSLFAGHGITQEKFLGEFQNHTKSVSDKMTTISDDFQTLQAQLQAVIEEKIVVDKKLAGEFRQWKSEL